MKQHMMKVNDATAQRRARDMVGNTLFLAKSLVEELTALRDNPAPIRADQRDRWQHITKRLVLLGSDYIVALPGDPEY